MARSIDPRRETLRGCQWPSMRSLHCLELASRKPSCLASVHVRAHQQAGHMDASDPITSPQKILQGGCRPHMTARRQHVEDGLHNPSQSHRSRPASMRRRGHERFDQGPFGIGEVACVAQSRPAISSPSDFSPGHCESVCCCKPTESQPAEIAQLSFTVRL